MTACLMTMIGVKGLYCEAAEYELQYQGTTKWIPLCDECLGFWKKSSTNKFKVRPIRK